MMHVRLKMVAGISLILMLAIGACSQRGTTAKQPVSTAVQSVPSIAYFDSLLMASESRLLVFDLYADWCMPCRVLSPILEQIAAQNKARVSIYKANVDKLTSLTARFGVSGIPYVLYIKHGQVVASFMGVQPRETYLAAIDRFSGSDTNTVQAPVAAPDNGTVSAFETVDAARAIRLIDSANAFVLDVRSAEEFKQEHIKEATLIPVNKLPDRINELSAYKNTPVLVYCRSGNRSATAARILQAQGFTKIYNLQLGMIGWKQAQLPVVK